MSDSSSVKGFINRSTQIVCPKCGYVTRQKCAAMLQDVILICPNCETRFELSGTEYARRCCRSPR
ncbi:YnfU family zinc-binding protein [Serratia marcescens]|uniref:YnfU family zinc-binding protein n=1 Tax=Serratia marcescens TaxID=615 RepID=UPI00296772E9|nr:YnfU family zinc-binding protein [Serratia marcescens]WOX38430.1 YnfU family zinc-binding protein [Serratia marcescens]